MDSNVRRVKSMLENPGTFILGLTIAFALGDNWIMENIAYTFFDEESRAIQNASMDIEYHSTSFTTNSSSIIVATAGTLICWVKVGEHHKLYNGSKRNKIYLAEKETVYE